MSVVVETPEVVPKPCNLFFIGQLGAGPPSISPLPCLSQQGQPLPPALHKTSICHSPISAATEPPSPQVIPICVHKLSITTIMSDHSDMQIHTK